MNSDTTLLYNCNIHTANGDKDWMQITGNRITKIGEGNVPKSTNKIDLDGGLVLPGLHDSHIHVYSLGRMSARLQLKNVGSISELQNLLDQFAKANDHPWIIGYGWDQDMMEDGRYPDKSDIDKIVSDKPVLLYRACNHIGLFNSKALEIIGIDETTNEIDGGKIDRDESGIPTGILREAALDLVTPYIRDMDEDRRLDYYRNGIYECLNAGLTAVHTNDKKAWEFYKTLQENDELPIRVFLTVPYSEISDESTPQPGQRVGMLECRRVKLFADGSLGAETAALREPYEGSTDRGILIDKPDVLFNKIINAHEKGYQLEIHAIGDRAAQLVMDGFEYAGITAEDRPIITHCQILGEDLIERMRIEGYIANIQPPFVPTDARWAEKRLGQTERLKYSYAWKTIVDNNVHTAGGSDAPIEKPDPFWGIYCSIKRPKPDGGTWRGDESLDFEEALKIYTFGGAYAVYKENELGEIKEGMLADFVVTDPEIREHPQKLVDNPLRQVWVDGIKRLG